MIKLQEIIKSHQRIKPFILRTPIFTNNSLNKMTGTEIFCKCENFQKSGAFKIRGATNAVELLSQSEMEQGVATASSGNHGAALSMAVSRRKKKVTVVMPDDSSQIKVDNVLRNGGEIIWCKPNQKSRENTLKEFVKETNSIIIHPYNDKDIIAGQGTAALELIEEQPDLDIIITPLSGGGLLSGTLCAIKNIRSGIQVYGAEPKEADDAYRSLIAGRRLSNKTTKTICDGLRAQVGEINFLIIKEMVDGIITLSEKQIIDAMYYIWERMKIIVEPSSAIVLAAVLKNKNIFSGKKIGLIFSGGNVNLKDIPW